ncbi:MAG: sigma-70 family RNA polymerase sigma factor [Bacteroidales bacterium]|nr:sigma-70 family RNA polymerase sigma factor [Bacteroidales bacterium]
MSSEEFKIQVLPLKHKLFRLSLRLLGKVEDAEDIVQDALTRMWQKRDELVNFKNVEAFAMVMTKNMCLDRMRSKAYQTERLASPHDVPVTHNPEEIMVKTDLAMLIHKIIDGLPEQMKVIIHLRDIEGMEYEQIADIMNMNINAIRVNLSRARKKVRDTLYKLQDYELAGN